MQRLDERLHLVLQHAGHQPFAAFVVHLVQHKQRHGDGQAVLGVARFVQVGSLAVHTAQADGFGESVGGDACGLVAHQLFAGQPQQVRLLLLCFAVPALKASPPIHVGGQLLVVKGVDQLVVHQHVLAARFVLQVFDLFDEFEVGLKERKLAVPLATHQRFADEHLACAHRVKTAKVGAPPAVDHDAIQRGPLQRGDFARLLFPMRVEQLFLEQMARHLLHPLRLDRGDAPAKQARGFHQFSHNDPAAWFLAQVCARVAVELDAACTQVFSLRNLIAFGLPADVAQQAGQHGEVDLFVAGGRGVQAPFVLGHHGMQLAVDVAPLAHAADVDEVLAQQLLVLAVAEFVGALAAFGVIDPLPQGQVPAEFTAVVVELGMRLVGLGLHVHGAVAHVLHAQSGCNHQHFVQRLARAGLQNHAAHTRVEWQLGQLASGGGQLVRIVHRAQFVQQLVTVGNGAAGWALQKRKVVNHTQVQRLHAQDDACQGAAQDFRVGEAGTAIEVGLVI